jgi:hypothetical protein
MILFQRYQTRRAWRIKEALIKRSRRPYSQSVYMIGYPAEQARQPERKVPRWIACLTWILIAASVLAYVYKA